MKHSTTVKDVTVHKPGGYGPMGHGVWVVVCTCGYKQTVNTGARNRALCVETDHLRNAR